MAGYDSDCAATQNVKVGVESTCRVRVLQIRTGCRNPGFHLTREVEVASSAEEG